MRRDRSRPVLVDAQPVLVDAQPVLVDARPVLVNSQPVPVLVDTQPVSSNIPVSSNSPVPKSYANRTNEILFIDARNLGHLINRRTRELSQEDISKITSTYHNWRNAEGNYEDIAGFCASAPISKVAELDYVLTPGRYVGLPDDEDDFDFAERFTALKAELEGQLKEEEELNKAIAKNLAKIKV